MRTTLKKRLISILLILTLSGALTITASANNTKLVALTFDDGPSYKYTPTLLDALEERNVHVTFFLVGYTLKVNKDIAQRAFENGHQLANHSNSHAWFTKLSAQGIADQLSPVDNMLTEITGETEFMIRVPYGAIPSTVKGLKWAPIIQWSVDPGNGYMSTSEADMYNNLLNMVNDGSIIILHDSNEKNLNVAISAIDALLEQGYEFVTLDELFRLRGVTPVNGQVYYSVPCSPSETGFDESRLSEHWAYEHILDVKKSGIMEGDGEGFKPNGYMTRAMAAVILKRLEDASSGIQIPLDGAFIDETPETVSGAFSDVAVGSWYYNAVEWAAASGYIKGVGDGLFDPNSFITKEQFYTLLARYASGALEGADKTPSPAVYRDDVRISGWAAESVRLFRSTGFSSKNDPEIFRPGDFMTRAEAAELVDYVTGLKGLSPYNENAGGSQWALRCFLIGDSLLLCSKLFINKHKVHRADDDLND